MTDEPQTQPASAVHPSWGVNVSPGVTAAAPGWYYDRGGFLEPQGAVSTNELVTSGAIPGVRRGAHRADESPKLVQSTPTVIVSAMFFITVCVLILTLARQPVDAALLAGLSVIIGAILAVTFRGRWR